MPKLVGKATRVVEVDGLTIEELAGNVASNDDTISIARVTITKPTSEPWLTLQYDEWICVLKGRVDLHSSDGSILSVQAGETCLIDKGERFRPVFPEGGTEYIPVCLPAFKPERCLREEEGVSTVSTKLHELHSQEASTSMIATNSTADTTVEEESDTVYHMCQKSLWDEALDSGMAYFPPTFEQDGFFTHATADPARLVDTANHFYSATAGDWICLEISKCALKIVGIDTRFEEPKAVGKTAVGDTWSKWRCPHIFGGIQSNVVTRACKIIRDDSGAFLSIDWTSLV